MPSVNWREAADNWFGACCCSFGGISEKLVTRYANSYTCAKGLCLLSTTSVVVCKDDLLGCPFPNSDGSTKCEPEHDFAGEHSLSKEMLGSANIPATTVSSDNPRLDDFDGLCAVAEEVSSKVEDEVNGKAPDGERLSCMFRTCEVNENGASASGCCINKKSYIRDHDTGCCTLDASISSAKDPKSTTTTGIPGDRKSFLNGFLGNAFMARSSNLSKEVQWTEFLCPQCSCLLGAYPCANGNSPLDGGVRFFKSYISTCLPVGGSDDLFRKYTLEAMFTNQLLENAKDELSYRTVVRDLQSKRPMLQIVLLNPDSWCCSGDCSTMEPKIDMYPSVKVLFSDCCDSTEVQLRIDVLTLLRGTEEWVTKNQADEVYMLASQIKELIESLRSANNILPPSHTFLQGFTISSLRRCSICYVGRWIGLYCMSAV
ncbi:hypothetical protein RJ640_011176 [Escallonia rubra]|uniref:Uncharacterized protein n=1 Tax=Escallonia rubra TaxID=112253 RepID=A0AA88RT40_9ASTE|nr:hypothetical protein RJ640_011176 [Escallonia rubra]